VATKGKTGTPGLFLLSCGATKSNAVACVAGVACTLSSALFVATNGNVLLLGLWPKNLKFPMQIKYDVG